MEITGPSVSSDIRPWLSWRTERQRCPRAVSNGRVLEHRDGRVASEGPQAKRGPGWADAGEEGEALPGLSPI